MTRYQVVAECAHATVESPYGKSVTLLLKGALVPENAPQLQHLIDIGAVAKVDGDESGGVDATGRPSGAYTTDVPAGVTSTPVEKSEEQLRAERDAAAREKADADLAGRRAAAKAKLPEDGSEPDGRASKDVWVEYLVSKGSRYEDVQAADKPELQKLAKQQQS